MSTSLLLGAHLSVAGGLHKAVEAARVLGMNTLQIFTRSPSQWAVRRTPTGAGGPKWRGEPLPEENAAGFRAALAGANLAAPLIHSSYLINLASPDADLWQASIAALVDELRRAEQLGVEHVVLHPGAHMGEGEAAGLARVAKGLNEALRRSARLRAGVLLENTAGQGTTLGHLPEHLGAILAEVKRPDRVGACFDTCHAFAAGHALAPAEAYEATWRNFLRHVPLAKFRAFHVNDSQREFGSRVDRHAHVGQGKLGLDPFRLLLRDPRFRGLPMVLETPKGRRGDEDWDAVNLRVLRELAEDN